MILNWIHKELIYLNPVFSGKEEMFALAAKQAAKKEFVESSELFERGLCDREDQGSTELKPGVAIPHAKLDTVSQMFVFIFITPKKTIKFSPGFGKGVSVSFLIGAPRMDDRYISLLASIARLIEKDEFLEELKGADVPEDVLHTIEKYSLTAEAGKEGRSRSLVVLILQVKFPLKMIMTAFLELGIRQPVQYSGDNLVVKQNLGLSFLGFSASDVRSPDSRATTIQGICDDPGVIKSLYGLLKKEGIDLDQPGIGSLYTIPLPSCYGGINPEIQF